MERFEKASTVRQNVESIYYAVDRYLERWDESLLHIPPQVERRKELKEEFLEACNQSFESYERLVEEGVEKRDAIYVIPHSLKVGMKLWLDGYHLFDPFGFIGVRACTTADYEIVLLMNDLIKRLSETIPEAKQLLGPKCKLGYCPEREFCGLIKKFVKEYDEELHKVFN
ncbi:MAG: FAD-dependent thymidylate synthase [Candidatus Aenigmarchaeota archaeon]|nr:FAD-dependent thymidylate synthase [Candidatus Aenigmarchaeota archaeon]